MPPRADVASPARRIGAGEAEPRDRRAPPWVGGAGADRHPRTLRPTFELELLPAWLAEWAAAITAEKGAALDLGANLALGVVSGGDRASRPGLAAARLVRADEPVRARRARPWAGEVTRCSRRRCDPCARSSGSGCATGSEQRAARRRSRARSSRSAARISSARPPATSELDPEQPAGAMMDELARRARRHRADAEAAPADRGRHPGGARGPARRPRPDHRRLRRGRARCSRTSPAATRAARPAGTCSTRRTPAPTSSIDRKSSGAVIVFDPALTLVIATQPDMLRTLAGKPGAGGRGVLARPLYALPGLRLPRRAHPAGRPGGARRVRAPGPRRLQRHARARASTRTTTRGRRCSRSTAAARRALRALRARAQHGAARARRRRRRRRRASTSAGSRSSPARPRASPPSSTAPRTGPAASATNALVIDEPTVERAIALARYYRRTRSRVFGLMGELPMQALARRDPRLARSRNRGHVGDADRARRPPLARQGHDRRPGARRAQAARGARLRAARAAAQCRAAGGRPTERVQCQPRNSRTSLTHPTDPTKPQFCRVCRA